MEPTITMGQAFGWEFLGTAILILLGTGVNAANSLRTSSAKGTGWLMISLGWGFAVLFGASIADVSGGHLNPAVTLTNAILGNTEWSLVPSYIMGQVLGATCGAVVTWLAFKQLFDANNYDEQGQVTHANRDTGGIFYTIPAHPNNFWNTVTEFLCTAVLVLFVVFGPSTATDLGSLKYFAVGFLIASVGMSLGTATGFAMNPARDFGPRLAYQFLLPIKDKGGANWSYAWVPIVGPLFAAAAVGGLGLLIV